jgi:hypothetical protein
VLLPQAARSSAAKLSAPSCFNLVISCPPSFVFAPSQGAFSKLSADS